MTHNLMIPLKSKGDTGQRLGMEGLPGRFQAAARQVDFTSVIESLLGAASRLLSVRRATTRLVSKFKI